MFMVVMIHVLGYGGIRDAAEKLSVRYNIAWLMNTSAYCAVNCYAMISGYAGLYSERRYSRLISLWFRVVFYTLSITLFFALTVPGSVGLREWAKAIFPVMSRQYWYFTAYFGLFFVMPFLNAAVRSMPEEALRLSLAGLFFAFSLLQTFFRRDVFGTSNGFSLLWLMFMYIVGAYFRKSGTLSRISKSRALCGYALCVISAWASKLAIGDMFKHYTSPLVAGSAVFLMSFCLGCRLSESARKVVSFLAPLTFSVYLIHLNRLFLKFVLMDRFRVFLSFPAIALVPAVMAASLAIYLCCSFVDVLRVRIFRALRVERVSERIENFLLSMLRRSSDDKHVC